MIWNIVLIGLNFTLHRRPHLYILLRSLFILKEEVKGLVKCLEGRCRPQRDVGRIPVL